MQNTITNAFTADLQEQLVLFFGTRNPTGVKQTILLLMEQYKNAQSQKKTATANPVIIDCTALLLLLAAAEKEVANWEIDYTSHRGANASIVFVKSFP